MRLLNNTIDCTPIIIEAYHLFGVDKALYFIFLLISTQAMTARAVTTTATKKISIIISTLDIRFTKLYKTNSETPKVMFKTSGVTLNFFFFLKFFLFFKIFNSSI